VTAGPLAGVRVVDFSLYLPGPYATRLLADLGADVVKVEPHRGDPITGFLPGVYEILNRGKQVLTLDLKAPGGRELAHELVRGADVVVEGFRPGVADRLGIAFAACAASRPGLVYCSLSGYGQTGPDRARPGHDIGYEASGGAYAATLLTDDPLTVPHVAVGDVGGALFAATTICAHLAGPRTQAVHLDVAMQEAVTHIAVTRWAAALGDEGDLRIEDLASFSPGAGFFRTRDGRWVALAAVEDKFWRGLCAALEAPALGEPPFDTHHGRMRARSELRGQLAEHVARVDLATLDALLREHDVPLDVVRTAGEVAADPHLQERGLFVRHPSGVHVDFPVIQGTRRSFGADGPPRRDPPELLAALGLDAARIAQLRAAGALAPARGKAAT
jgi:crotonobetainyl-CoA:carnitine CoA-transferase CaiB-like acyl-CoA transferase